MTEDKLLKDIAKLVEDLGFDYDRFSESGKATYDELCSAVNKLVYDM